MRDRLARAAWDAAQVYAERHHGTQAVGWDAAGDHAQASYRKQVEAVLREMMDAPVPLAEDMTEGYEPVVVWRGVLAEIMVGE